MVLIFAIGINCESSLIYNCSSKSLNGFKYSEPKFYNQFVHDRLNLRKNVSTYFFFFNFVNQVVNNFSVIKSASLERSTFLLTTEINLYNRETEVWTILKGNIHFE